MPAKRAPRPAAPSRKPLKLSPEMAAELNANPDRYERLVREAIRERLTGTPPPPTGGRPRIMNANMELDAIKFARKLYSDREIAARLGVSVDTLKRQRKRSAAFASGFEDARILAIADAKSVVVDELDGRQRLQAAEFMLRYYGDASEKLRLTGGGSARKIVVRWGDPPGAKAGKTKPGKGTKA